MLTSHAELSGLRQGWRIITVSGNDGHSPNKALEIRPNVCGRILVRALSPRSKHVIELGRQVRWIGLLDINLFSCFWKIPKEKRDKPVQIIHRESRQGNKVERADLERLVGLFDVGRRFHASLETLTLRFLSGCSETHSNIVVASKNSVR